MPPPPTPENLYKTIGLKLNWWVLGADMYSVRDYPNFVFKPHVTGKSQGVPPPSRMKPCRKYLHEQVHVTFDFGFSQLVAYYPFIVRPFYYELG